MTAPSQRILVVDDELTARLLMRAALRKAGFDVEVAASGEEALQLFEQSSFDLVMLDVAMPGLSGHQVCTALRQRLADSKVDGAGELLPIVMVTGMDDVLSVEKAYECGATDFIAKPIHWALIGHRVRYLLRGQRALQDLHAAEARNAAVLGALPDRLWEVDVNGVIVNVHVPAIDPLREQALALRGQALHQVLPAAALQVSMQALLTAQQQGVCTGLQIEFVGPKRSRWFELSVSRKAAMQTPAASGGRISAIVLPMKSSGGAASSSLRGAR
jgi:DNA-binding response OmpR family regulator